MPFFIFRRLITLLPVVLGVVTMVFLLIHMIPGDPVEIMLGENASSADKRELAKALNLDKPIFEQYVDYLKNLADLNLGDSIVNKKPVMELIGEHYPNTLKLTIFSMFFAAFLAVPLGVISALKKHSAVDYLSSIFSVIGVSMPNFWLGPMLIIIFSIFLGILPVSGDETFAHIILPSLTLGLGMSAILSRMMRAQVIENMNEDYVRTARAKGAGEFRVIFAHVLKNAMIPVITIMGFQFGALLAGSIITETIFSWPGIGSLTIKAINSRDYPLVSGCILVISISYVLVNFFVDMLYKLLDKRVAIK